MPTVEGTQLLTQDLIPVDETTVSLFWNDLKELHARIKACKSFAQENIDNGESSAAWAAVIEILEGRMN